VSFWVVDRDPERYWSFPFIASREGPVIYQKGWREKKERKKERKGCPGAVLFPFPCRQALTVL
jgi:hypothetical protein